MDLDLLTWIFFPYMAEKSESVKKSNSRFVYYTDAATAVSILQNREVWMRSPTVMNDFMEIDHGFTYFNEVYKSEIGINFKNAINAIFPEIAAQIENFFNEWLPTIRQDTYIACFSEHLDDEDQYGRLSMWRAYGREAGVALVFRSGPFFMQNPEMGLVAGPVAYWTKADVEKNLSEVTRRIIENREKLAKLGEEHFVGMVFELYKNAILCSKHPGFSEELEWRVISAPPQRSPLITNAVHTIRGTPQRICKLHFHNIPDLNINGINLEEFLDRVIIGTSAFPSAIIPAIQEMLPTRPSGEKIPITFSDIPLRLS